MKKILTKIGYMAFGSLLTLIGYYFGSIDNNSANAQESKVVRPYLLDRTYSIVDEVHCRRLVILGDDEGDRITLETDLYDRGMITIYNEKWAERIALRITNNTDSGILEITGKESGGPAASLGVDINGGFMALFNNVNDKTVLQAAITNKGEGFIITRDKVGYQTGAVGPEGASIFKDKTRN